MYTIKGRSGQITTESPSEALETVSRLLVGYGYPGYDEKKGRAYAWFAELSENIWDLGHQVPWIYGYVRIEQS